MKKSKVLFATLAATVFATSAGALVACGDGVNFPDNGLSSGNGVVEITFHANGGLFADNTNKIKVKTDANGHIAAQPQAPTLDGFTFVGYSLTAEGGAKITYGSDGYKFIAGITVYAQWEEDGGAGDTTYTIAFENGEHGTVSTKSVTTGTDGKIVTWPTVTPETDWQFGGWKIKDGAAIQTDYVFTKDETVVATYTYVGEQNDEFEIIFDGGEHGSIVGNNVIETDGGKIAQFPDVSEEVGWTHTGWALENKTPVTGDTVFTANETVYAVYEEDIPTEGDYNLYVNGTFVKALLEGDGGGETRPDNLVFNYYAENVTLEAGDKVTFALKDIELTGLWAEKNTAIKGTTATQGVDIAGLELEVSVAGTYTVSYTQYDDQVAAKKASAYIGPLTGGGDDPDPQPVGPEKTFTSATANNTTMEDNTQYVDRVDKDGKPINQTLTDEYCLKEFTISEVTTYKFKADGTAIDNMWIKHPAAIQVRTVDNSTVPDVDTGNGGANGAGIKLAAGTYSMYLQYYSDSSNWVLWVEGTQTGDFVMGEDPMPVPDRVHSEATINDTAMTDATDDVDRGTPDKPLNQTLADQFHAALTVTEETTYSFKADGKALATVWIEHAEGIQVKIGTVLADSGMNGSSFTLAAGTYDVYLKYFSNGGWSVWIAGDQTGEFGGDVVVTKKNGIYIGDDVVGELVVNTGDTNTGRTQYWLGAGKKIQLTANDVVSIYIGGQKITNIYSPDGIAGVGTAPFSELKASATGSYIVYLSLWKDSGNYTVEFVKATDVGTTTEAKGTMFTLTGSDGKSITIYLADANGNAVTLSQYKMWAWNDDGNTFPGEWDARPTVSANMTTTKALGDKISFKFTKGSAETNNLNDIATGATYVVTIGADNQLSIKQLVEA